MRFLIKDIESAESKNKLSVKDKKLVQLLIQNSRTSVSNLSKAVGISKPAISQKITSLKNRGILLDEIMYTNINILDSPMHLINIGTGIGCDNQKVSKEILEIKDVLAILWYNGPFNLLVVTSSTSPQNILEDIEKITHINKYRLMRIKDNWFHPPHFFKEVKDKKVSLDSELSIPSKLDIKILDILRENPKENLVEISHKAKSSHITVKKRMTELEKNKSILGFSYYVNLWLCGKEMISVNFKVLGERNTKDLISNIIKIPEVGNIWEFDHEWNINAVFYVDSQSQANKIIENLNKHNKGIKDIEVSVLSRMVGK